MDIKCDVINDLLPLYVDEVISEASRELVENHILECDYCKATLRNMKEEIKLPVNQELRMEETRAFKSLKKIVSNWKFLTGIIATVSIVMILILTTLYMTSKTLEIPYQQDNITFEHREDGYYIRYHGQGDILYSASGGKNGEWQIEFSQTLWDKYIQPLYRRKVAEHWFCEIGAITKLSTYNGITIWEANEEEKKAFEQWNQNKKDSIKR